MPSAWRGHRPVLPFLFGLILGAAIGVGALVALFIAVVRAALQ